MGRVISFALGLIWVAAAASASAEQILPDETTASGYRLQPAEAAGRVLDLDVRLSRCATSEGDADIVVCRDQSQSADRLDREVFHATRQANSDGPQPSQLNLAVADKCDPASLRGCGAASPFSLTAVAITAIKAGVLALQGDDWREALPAPRPNAYDHYTRSRGR